MLMCYASVGAGKDRYRRARRGCDLQIAEDGDDQDHVERRWNPGDAGGLVAAAARGLQT